MGQPVGGGCWIVRRPSCGIDFARAPHGHYAALRGFCSDCMFDFAIPEGSAHISVGEGSNQHWTGCEHDERGHKRYYEIYPGSGYDRCYSSSDCNQSGVD